MKQKTRIASKLFAALVVLTLISCCFLGTTFARYTSSSSGAAQVQVATWNVSITGAGAGSGTIGFGKLSPDDSKYTGAKRLNQTKVLKVATITNNSDVEADITLTVGANSFAYGATSATTFNKAVELWDLLNRTTNIGSDEGDVTESDLLSMFTIVLYEDAAGTDPLESTSFTLGTEGTEKTKDIYAKVVWTTDDTNSTYDSDSGVSSSVKADDMDTFVGMYVTTVNWSLSYTAVQGSELPKPSTP